MTIAACYLSPEGVVLGADSTSSFYTDDGFHYFNNAQKLFEIGEGSTLGMIVWGMGSLDKTSFRSLVALLADEFRSKAPLSVAEVMDRWIDRFWTAYTDEHQTYLGRVAELGLKQEFVAGAVAAGARSEEEEEELAELRTALEVGFCIAGYVEPDREPHALQVTFDPRLPKPCASSVPMDGYGFWGAPHMVSRLLDGFDSRVKSAIVASPFWSGDEAQLESVLSPFALGRLRMPIRDAVDFIYSHIFSTIKAFKFSKHSQICGGPIELAVIRTDRKFEWIRHKPWDAALQEGAL
jgi:hypothetical protein